MKKKKGKVKRKRKKIKRKRKKGKKKDVFGMMCTSESKKRALDWSACSPFHPFFLASPLQGLKDLLFFLQPLLGYLDGLI